MSKYIICNYGDNSADIPSDIKANVKGEIDFIKDKDSFLSVVSNENKPAEDLYFYIASRKWFYHVFNILITSGVAYDQIIKPKPLIKVISINNENYSLREEFLTNPSKPINKLIAKDNLLLFKAILESTDLGFFLIYGTLLGAIREADFITHDSDTDLGMFFSDREAFLPIIFKLHEAGLELVRYSDNLMSFMKSGEYIDLYFFKAKLLPKYGWYCDKLFIPHRHLTAFSHYSFYQEDFLIPATWEGLLVDLYGKSWRTPIKGKHALPLTSFKSVLARYLPVKIKYFIAKFIK